MKANTKLVLGLLLTVGFVGNSQTAEQRKMMEEAEKKVAKAQRISDSIMNTPQMKAVMDQMKALEEVQQPKTTQKEKQVVTPKSNDDFYWRNTTASDTHGKFAKWTGGKADFGIIGHQMKDGTGNYKFFKMGSISSDGKLAYDLPTAIQTRTTLSQNNNLTQGSFLDFNSFEYTNGDSGFIGSFTLQVIRDGKPIGLITMGNSIKAARNLSAPCCSHLGDEGYRLYWTYAKNACAMNYEGNWNGKVNQGEVEGEINVHHSYKLNFKPGWNIVKTESRGAQSVANVKYGKTRENYLVSEIPSDTKYFFQSSDVSTIKIAY